jgi:NAD(P)-dependent dehydrogenase (short-subunit alcohol dehydrogenase family)
VPPRRGSNPRKDLDVVTMDLEKFDRTIQLNVRSAVLGCRLAIPHLAAAGGASIINTASISGLCCDYTQTGYGTSKAAVIRLTEYVAT